MTRPIRLLIVDDHALVRKGLAMVLRLEPDIEIISEAKNGHEGLEAAQRLQPDVALIDLAMPEMDGRALAAEIRHRCPSVKIIILTGLEVDEHVFDLFAIGVEGYVVKSIEPGELVSAIRSVMHGEVYIHPEVARKVMQRMRPVSRPTISLTPREKEILEWLATPNTYRQIAAHLHISEETVRTHVKNIMEKLCQPNRAQTVLAALRLGLITLDKQQRDLL